ncbi:MAG: helix-turn-helix domain-containing protein [Afipia felis]|nr:helix-turn-helix domain-containing protein [Afipia felis]
MPSVTASRVGRSDGIPIGELSRLTGVNIETIRYYEKVKVLQPPHRTEGGRRIYGPTDTRVLAFIRRGRELGFGLQDIRTLLALGGPGKTSCADARKIAAHHLDDIRTKIADLRKLERLLTNTIAQCSGTSVPDCPILDVLDVRR